LGALKAGAGYVMLDPDLPAARLQVMLAESGAKVVVAQREGPNPWTLDTVRTADVRDVPCHTETPDGPGDDGDVACVMFTSGSTGRPKGIVTSHRAIVATLTGQDFAGFGPGSVWL